jgi:DNA-binding NtrC family response regulator
MLRIVPANPQVDHPSWIDNTTKKEARMNRSDLADWTASGPCPRVLVVDDRADWRELLALQLQRLRALTIPASTVEEAITVLECTPVDLVVTDHRMPGSSGLDLLAYVHARHPDLPVILTSAVVDDELASAALAGGAAAVLEKNELLPTLRSLVGLTRAAA